MNVGIVSTWFARGNAYVGKQYMSAVEHRHPVFIYSRGSDPISSEALWNGPNVTLAAEPVCPEESSIDLGHFDRWLRERRVDLVIFNEQRWLEPVLLCARRRIRTAAFLVEYRREELPHYALYDVLLAHTRQHLETFPDHKGVCYVPWGTTLTHANGSHTRPAEPGKVVFFHSAGMNPDRKGTDLVLEAYRRSLDRGLANSRLVVHSQRPLAGYGWRQRQSRDTLQFLLQSGNTELVERSFEHRDNVYRLGDVCLYPARFDGLGLTVAEANASGMPVVAPDDAPWNEFITPQNGVLIPCVRTGARDRSIHPWVEADVEALSESMLRWAPSEVESAKKAAQQYAHEKLDWLKNARGLAQFLENAPYLEKSQAIEAAAEFERRKRRSLRQKVSFSFPWMVKAARNLYRTLVQDGRKAKQAK